MDILGYLASAMIGFSLGLVGSGGSILTIPVMVYLFHIEPTLATAYSLFIVGITALVGGILNSYHSPIDLKATTIFAMPSLLGVFVTRRWIVPMIPHELAIIGGVSITRDMALMLLFALLMLTASINMIRVRQKGVRKAYTFIGKYLLIALIGTAVGLITGLVGAGGGFLIIPALISFAGLPMKKAVGSSLLVIATNSLIGFIADIATGRVMDFSFLLLIALIAVAGILLGGYLSHYIQGEKLKKIFGWFVLSIGVLIIVHQVWL